MKRSNEIALPTSLRDRLAAGHPWVYRNHLPEDMRLPSGTWVRLRCGGWSGWGLWDASGPIAIRVYSVARQPDDRLIDARIRRAWDLRASVRQGETDAYRWVFGEGDGLPGITVDRYGRYASIASYSAGAATLIPAVVAGLRACDRSLAGVVARSRDDDSGRGGVELVWGEAPPERVEVSEHGLRFVADLYGGQKTGLFLDHRENRRFIEWHSAGRSVLNCFAYTGAFSLYALRGGAASVISADIGKGLAEDAAENIRLSRLDERRHSFVTEDCFALLGRYAAEGRRFDMVILDPPSFARNRESRFAAQRAYTRINELALRCIKDGGWLASASCTSQVGPEAFKEALAAAGAQAKKTIQIVHEVGQPIDHPVPAGFPEGRYLKFVFGRISATDGDLV